MQDDSLKNFKKDINNIREYIKHIELLNVVERHNRNIEEVSLKNFMNHTKSFSTTKKLFEYKAIIISLYGLLENTISKWIQEHIQVISLIVVDYNSLDEKFRDEHFNLSIRVITLINESRYSKFDNMDKYKILNNLNQSMVTPNNFELNSEVYIPISGNLKHSKIIEAFKPLDIELSSLSTFLHKEIIVIDDLVVRRNDIAHGVEIDEILAISEFENFILALERYMVGIFQEISQKEFDYQSKIYIDKVEEIFSENMVCIVNLNDIELKIGDTLFIHKNKQYYEATILDIQENSKSIKVAKNGEFGLKLDCPIKKNSEIWKKGKSI